MSNYPYQHRHTFKSFDDPWPKTKFKKGFEYGDVSIYVKNTPEQQKFFTELNELVNQENKNHGKNI